MINGKPCNPWKGRKHAAGYGVTENNQLAHRVAYCLANGLTLADIDGVFIRHACDNPPCIESAHLVPGTHEDNMQDMRERARSNKGEKHGSAVLTRAQVNAMKARYVPNSKDHGAAQLAREYKISHTQARRIVNGERWQETTDSLSH